MTSKTWSKISGIVGFTGFIMAIVTPIIDSKAAPYEEEENYKKFEERYGLTPVNKEDK